MARENEERIKAEEENVASWLERGEWERAREVVGRWRYWVSVRERLERAGEEVEKGMAA